MADVTLSNAIRTNLLSLQNTSDLLGKTQGRLATGKKVNSALDNPTNFFTASALQSRSSDISRLLDSVSNGIQTLRAADTGIKSLTKLVENSQATARQALQAPKGQYEYSKAAIGGTTELTGDLAARAQSTVPIAADISHLRGATAIPADDPAKHVGSLDVSAYTTVAGDAGNIVINGTTIAVAGGQTTATVVSNINAQTATTGVAASVNATTGRLELTQTSNAADFNLTGSTVATLAAFGLTDATYEPTNTALAGLVATNSTLTIDDGSGPEVFTFGTTTATQAQSRYDLANLINASGTLDVTASFDADGKLVLKREAAGATQDDAFTVTGDAARATLGLGTASELESASLTAVQGKKLSIAVNDGTNVEFTLGNKAGQVGSRTELAARLNEINGISASFSSGPSALLRIDGDSTADKFRLGGDDESLAALGIARQTYSSSNTDFDDLAGRSVEISVGTSRRIISFGADAGVGQINSIAEFTKALSEIGAEVSTTPVTLAGTPPVTKYKLNLTTSDTKEDKNITISDASDSYALARLGIAKGTTESKVTAIIENNARRASLETDFNDLLKQVDALAKDASYNGVNLLDSDDLTVIFNEDGSSKLDISGVRFDSEGLALKELTPNDFQDDNKIEQLLDRIDTALGTLRTQASRFGSQLSVVETRKEFSKELVNVLETGAANLTLADTNEEAANVLALQTRQQLSTSALSLTSQAEQGVLRLFG